MKIPVSLACACGNNSIWVRMEVEEGATVADLIQLADLPRRFEKFKLEERCIGIFGKPVAQDAALKPGDRVEIYPGMAM